MRLRHEASLRALNTAKSMEISELLGWAAPAKKNEASIFFPPAKIEGARGHNKYRNATRIITDMDHKSA